MFHSLPAWLERMQHRTNRTQRRAPARKSIGFPPLRSWSDDALSAPSSSNRQSLPGIGLCLRAAATMPAMADWRQMQARIRKAKNSPDAHAKLSELYQRTHDAMVAWELALIQEKAELKDDAVKWYTIAAERFRRSEWKKKAEEALTRLGVALPVGSAIPMDAGVDAEERLNSVSDLPDQEQQSWPLAQGEIPEATNEAPASTAERSKAAPEASEAEKKKRRRGRRRKGAAAAPGLPSQAFAASSAAPPAAPVQSRQPTPRSPAPRTETSERATIPSAPPASSSESSERALAELAAPMLPS